MMLVRTEHGIDQAISIDELVAVSTSSWRIWEPLPLAMTMQLDHTMPLLKLPWFACTANW